ncbi:MAG: hypothetical protein ACKOW9_03050 [Candidatus Paceibacterota bacterium]
MRDDEQDLDSALLQVQNLADIKNLLRSGLSKQEVTDLMLFRASFIILLTDLLNSDQHAIDRALTPLLDQIILDHDPDDITYITTHSDYTLEQDSLEINENLFSLPLPYQLLDPSLPIEIRVKDLYSYFIKLLPAKNIAKEILVQLSDAQRGTGVWLHK